MNLLSVPFGKFHRFVHAVCGDSGFARPSGRALCRWPVVAARILLVGAFSIMTSGISWGQATPTPTPDYGANLLVNPGAETGDFTGWTTGGDIAGLPKIDPPVYTPSPPNHSGSHRFGSDYAWVSGSCYQYQEIAVTPGGWYEASFWVAHMPGEAEHVQLAWIDGTWPGTENVLLDVGPGNPGSAWIEYGGGAFQAGGSVVTIVVRYLLGAVDVAVLHVDDISVVALSSPPATPTNTPTETSTPTPTPTPDYGANLLVNPAAETGDFTGWTTGGDMAGKPEIDPPPFPPSPPNHSGSHRFGMAFAWVSGNCYQYQEIAVTPGGWYGASFWVAHMPGEDEHVQLAWIDGTWPGTENVLVDVGPGGGGSTWIEYGGGTFQAGGSIVTIVVRYLLGPVDVAALHVDDISVVPVPSPTATPTNTPTETLTPTATVADDGVYALDFDGGDHVVLGTDSRLNPTSAYTIEAWVKPEVTLNHGQIFTRWNGGSIGTYLLGVHEAVYFFSAESPWRRIQSTPPLVEEWTHVAGVFDGGTIRLFINGYLRDSKTGAGANVCSVATLIGALHDHGVVQARWRGLIDDVRFWNVARTETEINEFMVEPLQGNEPGLVGYWNFDEGAGQIAGDRSPNRIDGVLGASSAPGDDDPVWVISDCPLGQDDYTPPTPIPTPTATPWPNSFENIINGDFEMDTGYWRHVPMAWEGADEYYWGGAPMTCIFGGSMSLCNPFAGQAWMMMTAGDPPTGELAHDQIYQDVPVAVGAEYSITADLAFDGKAWEGGSAPPSPESRGRLAVDYAGSSDWEAADERQMQYSGLHTYQLSIGPFTALKSPVRVDLYGQVGYAEGYVYDLAIDNVEMECHSVLRLTQPVSPGFVGILDFGTVEAALEFISCATEGEIRVSRYLNTPLYLANSTGKFWHLTGLPEGAFSAILSFDYAEGEIPDVVPDESALSLWRSNNGGMTWYRVGSVVDLLANRVSTAEPQDSFSLWAIALYDAPETSARHWELYR